MRIGKKPLCLCFIIAAAVLSFTQEGRPEIIFKKDGSLVQGTIVQDAATYVTVRTDDKKTERVARANILRILYTKLYMGKVFVRLTDGKVLEAYKVDEDQDTYTFRKNLTAPEEFTVVRDKVMFIARSNPTDLAATAERTELALKWSPPFRPPISYKIYLKSRKSDYTVAAKTGATEHTLEGLTSNARYWMKVTAVDAEGVESMPTDEVMVDTKNFPPERPERVKLLFETSAKGKVPVLKWDKSNDPDGIVREYRVYHTKAGLLAKVNNMEYEVPAGIDPVGLTVRAVDDRNDESGAGWLLMEPWLRVGLYPAFIVPFGTLNDMFSFAMGATVSVAFSGVLFDNIEAGMETGYFYFFNESELIDCMHMVPLYFSFKYSFRIFDRFFIGPKISAGFAYMNIHYISSDESGLEPLGERTKNSFEPVTKGGIDVQYLLNIDITVGGGLDFGMIHEESEPLIFSTFNLGAGYSF